jgi:cytochrome c-type biogenesis protein CcmH
MSNLHNLSAVLRRRSSLVALALLIVIGVVWGVTAVRASQPKTLDQRTYEVASQLQCPVCHGESVADAPSPLAQEMRSLIREQLSQGMSEQQVIQYFHDRYGDTILERPPTTGFTSLIWLGPALMLLIGLFLLVSLVRELRTSAHDIKKSRVAFETSAGDVAGAQESLSAEERQRYRLLLRRELAAEEGYSDGEEVEA